jgi:CheY-like chemotaxis protein
MISKILEHHGITAEIAHNGEECLALVQESARTLVIVDLAMPRKDGWQTLAEIRGNPATRNLPVVAMTAYYALDVAEDAQRAGFDGFFPKPVSPKTFITSLEEILAGR